MKKGSGESIRDILVKLRYYASIATDLSLYSLAFEDREAAIDVLKIEREADELYKRLIAKSLAAFRSLTHTPLAIGLMAVSSALDTVTDASADMAMLTVKGYSVHPYIRAVACQGEAVSLIRSSRSISKLSARVDILVVRKGDRYIVAPTLEAIDVGDVVVVRGPVDEINQLAEALEAPGTSPRCVAELRVQAMGGDPLASTLLSLRSTSRVMVDLAFYSLLHNDVEIAESVAEMEEYVDKLYHEILESIVASSYSSRAGEMVSLLILAKSFEEFVDAALRIANIVRNKENAPVIASAVESGEEAYLRVRLSREDSVKLEMLRLEDRGFMPLAVYKPRLRDWITPPTPTTFVEPGDELILKYYRVGERVLEELEALNLEIVRVESR